MSWIFSWIASALQTIWLRLTGPSAPTTPVAPAPTPTNPSPKPGVVSTLTQLILSETESLGPMPGTGGVIHAVSPSTAALVAGSIVKFAASNSIKVSMLASLIRAESDFDDLAIDPNNQDAKPGETADQALLHADVGMAQEDITTAKGDAGMANLSLQAIEAKLFDPNYALMFASQTIASNLAWAGRAFAADVTLSNDVPKGDYRVLAMQAYNAGCTGALEMARAKGLAGNWSYGLGVVQRADKWAPLLDIA